LSAHYGCVHGAEDRETAPAHSERPEGHPGMVIRRAPPGETLYAAILMRAALVQAGIEVTGPAGVYSGEGRDHLVGAPADPDMQLASASNLGDMLVALLRGSAAPSPTILAVHESAPLPVLIRRVNKNSDNEWPSGSWKVRAPKPMVAAPVPQRACALCGMRSPISGALLRLPAGKWLGLGPPESRCPDHHGGPPASVIDLNGRTERQEGSGDGWPRLWEGGLPQPWERRQGGIGMSLRKPDCLSPWQGRLRPVARWPRAAGRLLVPAGPSGHVSGKSSCWLVGARRVTERW
jgi:hypothetical protein